MLTSLKLDLAGCLLFLSNLEKVGIYTITMDGAMKQEF
jgi:hypothetical protein